MIIINIDNDNINNNIIYDNTKNNDNNGNF